MSKTLSNAQYLAAVNAQLSTAVSVADVTRIARTSRDMVRIERVACGYRITEGK